MVWGSLIWLTALGRSEPIDTRLFVPPKIDFTDRYSLHLVDTIRIGADKSTLLTEGTRSTKDTLFFLTPESDEEKTQKERKPPTTSRMNGSPQKKTAGTKVLRNQTRRAVQDEVHTSAAARLSEHQRELHEKLQTEGIQRYMEGGGGSGGKEGKGWKKFQSYKGEAALPNEVDRMRVSPFLFAVYTSALMTYSHRFSSIGRLRLLSCQFMVLRYPSILTLSKMPARVMKETLPF